MRQTLLFFFICSSLSILQAQTTSIADTTIYKVVEEMPRFPGCEAWDTTIQVKATCAQKSLLSFIYKNVKYPMQARQNNTEGTVVTSFIVEPDSTISKPQIVKDIGDGCGEEVMRVISAMNAIGVRWVPGKKGGKSVRTQYVLPVKFRLEEAPPYILHERDTIYTTLDKPLNYKEGTERLSTYIMENLTYPAQGNDSCDIGYMDIQFIVRPDNSLNVLDVVDYNNLGFDFQFEAINAATSTMGNWEIAEYKNRKVPAAYEMRLVFIPTDREKCQQRIDLFNKANIIAEEGAQLYSEGKQEEGITKLTEAINLFPNNADFLYSRGQAYLDLNQYSAACADLTKLQEILSVSWYDTLLPIICNQEATVEE